MHHSTAALSLGLLLWLPALGGCADDASGDERVLVDPGECELSDLDGLRRTGTETHRIQSLSASCDFVAWVGRGLDGNRLASIFVYDIAAAAMVQTTPTKEDLVERWSVSLDGFWLAYAEPDAVVVENLRSFKRGRIDAAPEPGAKVVFDYPYVVWAELDRNDLVLIAADIETATVWRVAEGLHSLDEWDARDGRLAAVMLAEPDVVVVSDLLSGKLDASFTGRFPKLGGGQLAFLRGQELMLLDLGSGEQWATRVSDPSVQPADVRAGSVTYLSGGLDGAGGSNPVGLWDAASGVHQIPPIIDAGHVAVGPGLVAYEQRLGDGGSLTLQTVP